MSDVRIVIPGAAGRMGRMLVKAVHDMPGVVLAGALEQPGSIALGQDAGLLAGVGKLGVPITDDPLAAFMRADAVVDFTVPSGNWSNRAFIASPLRVSPVSWPIKGARRSLSTTITRWG